MRSLNTRIVLSAGLVLAVFIALTGLVLDRAFRESARSAREERLLGQLYLLIAAAEVGPRGALSLPATLPEARLSLPGSGLYAYVTGAGGKVLWSSPSAVGKRVPFETSLAPGQRRFGQRQDGSGQPFLVQGLGVTWGVGRGHYAFTFSVSEDLTEFNAQLRRYRHSLWAWLGAMAVLLLVTQWLVLRWGLRPLRRVAVELAAIESGGRERLQGEYPRELERLTDNLNALLAHERARQKRYRDALADLAHSLKTPLAVMRGALAQADGERLAATVEEEVVKMDRIVQYQLQRAATAAPSVLAAPVPIRPVAERIVATLGKVYSEKAVEARLAVDDRSTFRGDEGDLMELLGNLADNAYKWCRKEVRISAASRDRRLTISVEDDGPGIDEDQARRILRRGVRADQAVPGYGIGLAIVRDIVQAHGGEIRIGRAGLGGAAVTVKLPER